MKVRRSSVFAASACRAAVIGALFATLFISPAMGPANALAALGPDCAFFTYQDDAQTTLDNTAKDFPDLLPQGSANLDPDGNSIACDELPERPNILADTQTILGKFDDAKSNGFIVTGVGYSARYNLTLAGVAFTSDCPQIDADLLTSLAQPPDKQAISFFIASSTQKSIPPDEDSSVWPVVGLAWLIADDPSSPILANEWLLQAGLAKLDERTLPEAYADRLEAAEDAARTAEIGVWGSCDFSSSEVGAAATTAHSHLMRESGNGDQVVPFAIESEGTYHLTLDAAGGSVVFVAADVYATDGTLFPEMSITTGDSGAFSSAGYLYPGEYYIQIKSVGGWRLTIDGL